MRNRGYLIELGERLKYLRVNAKVKQEDIAYQIGVHRNTYVRLEKGQGTIENLVNALVVLNREDVVDAMLPKIITESPMQALIGGKRKVRVVSSQAAHHKKTKGHTEINIKREW
jgi:DNA-binding XRE family transcriptional regulator